MIGLIGLAVLAGVTSTLSPCVLPILPAVLGAAASEHRLGPLALATGLALSFTVIGLFIATIGFSVGVDAGIFRSASAILLIVIGAVLLVPRFQAQFALAAGPIGNWTESRFGGALPTSGVAGQFGIGLLLGAVWSPCVGPTLGAASVMAARGENLGEVSLTMFAFGVGAAAPLLALGALSRETLIAWRKRMLATGTGMKQAMGVLLLGVGLLILSGADKSVEAWLVDASPDWLTKFTTQF